MNGKIFNLIRGSTEDGPGLRTVVYFSGCSLDCAWCQNPEGKTGEPSLLYYAHKCIGCGACVATCGQNCHTLQNGAHVFDRRMCVKCGKCSEVCPKDALFLAGREISAEELVSVLERDTAFFRASGGGVTFSGGESILQNKFLMETLRLCRKKGISAALETALCYDYRLLENVLPYIGVVLADIKHTDPEKHRRFTGRGNETILENFRRLGRSGVRVIARCAVIPSFNDSPEELRAIVEFVREAGIKEFELLNFNDTIGNKYAACGERLSYDFGKSIEREKFSRMQESVGEIFSRK